MANSFLGLDTSSSGEARDWQNKRAKDGFEKVTPGDHDSPDSIRTKLSEPASKLDGLSLSPQLKPTV